MTTIETPRGNEGLEDLADGLISNHSPIDGGDSPEFGAEPWRAAYERHLNSWSRGFTAAWDFLQPQIDRANAAADFWYLRANHTPAEIREMQLAAMDEGWRAYWNAGMPSEVDHV